MIGKTSDMKNKTLVIAMIASGSFFVVQICGYTAFLWLQILFVAVSVFQNRKFDFFPKTKTIINFIFISLFLSAVSAQFTNMPYSYKKTAIVLPIMAIPMYFSAMYIRSLIKSQIKWIGVIKNGIRIAVAVQIIWVPLQLIFHKFLNIDINNLIFVDTLHCVDNATFVRSWKWYPSGLSWHSAALAPLFVIGYILWDNMYIRLAIIAESMLVGNTTTLIGVLLAVILMMMYNFFENGCRITISTNKMVIAGLFSLIVLVMLIKFDLFSIAIESIENIYVRLFGENKDSSTAAHMGYYKDYFVIIKDNSLIQTLFGYGYGCSGYPITAMYDMYANLGNWAVESDVVDILLSRGIVGAIIYYGFIFYIMLKGMKIDKRYFIMMLIIFIQGFGYNIQFDYVFMLEMIMYFTIKQNINFFDTKKLATE